jgi:hypothetical protein
VSPTKTMDRGQLDLQATTQIICCFFVCDSTTLCSSYFIDTNYSQNRTHAHTHTHLGAQDFLVCPKHHARHSFNSSQFNASSWNWIELSSMQIQALNSMLCITRLVPNIIESNKVTHSSNMHSWIFHISKCTHHVQFQVSNSKTCKWITKQNLTSTMPPIHPMCSWISYIFTNFILVCLDDIFYIEIFDFWKIVRHFVLWRYFLIFQHDLPLLKVFSNFLCKIWQIFRSKKVWQCTRPSQNLKYGTLESYCENKPNKLAKKLEPHSHN